MRFRVTALATVAVIAVLALSGVVLIGLQRETLTSSLDDSLARHADSLVIDVSGLIVPTLLNPRADEDWVAQLVAADGAVLAASVHLVAAPRISEALPPARGDAVRTVRTVITRKGAHRLLARRIVLRDGRRTTLYLAAPLDDVRGNIGTLTRSMVAAVPVMAAILAGLVWWLVGRTLRPVERIRSQVAAMGGTDTDQRVPEPAGDDEIARLARTMNAMLGRIEEATARQQRFVADASHELRTPLTRMRSEIEVDLAHPDAADLRATQRSVLEELIALQRLVEDLLLLARADSGVAPRSDIVNLDDIVLDEARQRRQLVGSIDTNRVSGARVRGDAEQLRRVVRNLLDNAVRHARSSVTLELGETVTGTTLLVADDGPGVPDDARQRIFERFTRIDGARAASMGGAGLGLAIAREIVVRHGGSISVSGDAATGARFVVTLPVA